MTMKQKQWTFKDSFMLVCTNTFKMIINVISLFGAVSSYKNGGVLWVQKKHGKDMIYF
jgi:hypothetical protein